MLLRLIYMSKAVDPQTDSLTDSILGKAHAWNAQNAITGVLCEGQGVYLQALEGERGTVTQLYARIFADPHFDPYSANGTKVMARIDELLARGKLVPKPLS